MSAHGNLSPPAKKISKNSLVPQRFLPQIFADDEESPYLCKETCIMIVIVLFICIIGFIVFCWWRNSPQQKGKRGEARVHKILAKLPDEYRVLDDIVLKTERGTTQIDHVVVSRYGLFAIETKNYRGDIYGDDCHKEWTQIIVTKVKFSKKGKTYTYVTKNKLYNPVKQAQGHAYRIRQSLAEWKSLKIVPIVVFTNKANLANVSSTHLVVRDSSLLRIIKSHQTALLTDADVGKIFAQLSLMNVRKSVSNRAHVRNLKKYRKEAQRKISRGICPRCGGTLVKRKGRYGNFYGCSNYPTCTFTHA